MSSTPATSASIMSHLVAHYPSGPASLEVARELTEAGVSFLELQFPFSDPTADGPAIQAACTTALEAGFRTELGFEMVETLNRETEVPIFIMTYASIAVAHGVEWFVARARDAGAHGLIVPDLPPDYDEGLYAAGRNAGLHVVPVLVPSTPSRRVEAALAAEPAYVYAALRKGITGSRTEVGPENIAFLEQLRARGVHVMAGFGIRTREQVEALSDHADTVVVGSAFVDAIASGTSVSGTARELVWGA
ncbi:MAG: tryptophan synthase subunit alpha [Spirochaetota bacterium]